MRMKSIGVTGLFGVFDHSIPLQSAEGVTIIHSPNGFGKTVILRMIAALLEGETSVFEYTPFSEFRLTLDDGTAVIVQRDTVAGRDGGRAEVALKYLNCDGQGNLTEVPQPAIPRNLPHSVLASIDKKVPSPYSLHGSLWRDDSGAEYSITEILQRFPRARAAIPHRYRSGAFAHALDKLRVFFVEANRLGAEPTGAEPSILRNVGPRYISDIWRMKEQILASRGRLITPRVNQYSRDVVRRIQLVLADYAKHSQERDRTFPERLVRFVQDGQTALPASAIAARMSELEKKRQRLISLGLLDSESGLRNLSEDDVRRAPEALTIYLGDVQEKLSVFDDIADRIGSLMDIVNGRFRYKQLRVDRETGFRVISNLNQTIQLEDLSSGEQHELVLLYELLFRAPKNCLLLIDEPEISLHVAWQSRFLSDLIGVIDLTGAYAIVATHSPTIIGTRWDLAVELKGPYTVR